MSQQYFARNGKQKRQRKRREKNVFVYELKRKAANERERKRMYSINEAFDKLRHLLPWLSKERKMSKASTLREAIRYIRQLSQLLNGEPSGQVITSSYATANQSENDRSSLIIPNSDVRFPVKFVELSCSMTGNDYDGVFRTEYGTMQGKCSKVWIPGPCEGARNFRAYEKDSSHPLR